MAYVVHPLLQSGKMDRQRFARKNGGEVNIFVSFLPNIVHTIILLTTWLLAILNPSMQIRFFCRVKFLNLNKKICFFKIVMISFLHSFFPRPTHFIRNIRPLFPPPPPYRPLLGHLVSTLLRPSLLKLLPTFLLPQHCPGTGNNQIDPLEVTLLIHVACTKSDFELLRCVNRVFAII